LSGIASTAGDITKTLINISSVTLSVLYKVILIRVQLKRLAAVMEVALVLAEHFSYKDHLLSLTISVLQSLA
ncbi:Hypothetical protein FKW44_014390, partial [Caligus rogercresseyi]